MNEKKLMRSNNKMVSGVCAGIAEYIDLDPTIMRCIYAVVSVFPLGFLGGVILYLALALIMPEKNQDSNQPTKQY